MNLTERQVNKIAKIIGSDDMSFDFEVYADGVFTYKCRHKYMWIKRNGGIRRLMGIAELCLLPINDCTIMPKEIKIQNLDDYNFQYLSLKTYKRDENTNFVLDETILELNTEALDTRLN